MNKKFDIAYFSAEIGISRSLPTYSGGLGILAGDHIKSAADLGLNMCGITLLYKEGYFKQRIDEEGIQSENYPKFDPYPFLTKLDNSFTLRLRERDVFINIYKYDYKGAKGDKIPIFFLDTDCDKNFNDDRKITLRLYSGDKDHRILQEAILGFGGMKMLRSLNQDSIQTYHMNEGHCSFLVLDLLEKNNGDIENVKSMCHFTTHTPVPAGHDHFSFDRVKKLIRGLLPEGLQLPSLVQDDVFHMTELGLYFSNTANGVSRLHEQVAQDQFKWKKLSYITNGVHHIYWMAGSFKDFYDVHLDGWRYNPELLFKVDEIPQNLVDEEVKVLSQGMTDEDKKKSKDNFEEIAKKRIKVGLILNEFGEQNQIKVSEQELQAEVQKQIRMMPGQEKMVMDFYQKNQSALASLRGTVYEEKILNLVKQKAKSNKKEVSKEEAEKILKQSQNQDEGTKQASKKKVETKKKEVKKTTPKTKSPAKKTKKVSKK